MTRNIPTVVIVGGGFAGISAAKALRNAPVQVLLIDRTNHHLFQPLLYQVATSVLAPGQIASPIRSILRKQQNTTVILGLHDTPALPLSRYSRHVAPRSRKGQGQRPLRARLVSRPGFDQPPGCQKTVVEQRPCVAITGGFARTAAVAIIELRSSRSKSSASANVLPAVRIPNACC